MSGSGAGQYPCAAIIELASLAVVEPEGDPGADAPRALALLVLGRTRTAIGELRRAARDIALARSEIAALADPGRLPLLLGVAEEALAEARSRAARRRPAQDPSDAELAVLRLLASDLSLRAIGDHLYRSRNTVKTQARELYRKLGASSREEALASARARGLIHP